MNSEKQYIELYSQCHELIKQGSHAALNSHRAEALTTLQTQGLPTLRNERYKYTDIQAAFEPNYGLNLSRLQLQADPYAAYKCSVPNMSSHLFYVVNDRIEAKDKLIDSAELFVGSITDFAEKHPDIFAAYYNKVEADGLTALNTLLSQEGAVIYVADNCKLDKAIQIVNLTTGNVPMMTNRRMLIIMGKNAEATLLVCHHSVSSQPHLTTEVAEVYLNEGSNLRFYNIEETADTNRLFDTTNIVQQAASSLTYATITLHDGLSRHTLDVHLRGTKAVANVSGLVIGGGEQHVDNNLVIAHEAEQCSSDVLYKYVLDDKSRGAFAGKVYVAEGAQKTESQETNANLCVSPQAHMYTQPMLEIYADDVKCNHGSTVGQLNETALFYMAQRGIDPAEGRRLLQQAFAFEVIDRIDIPALQQRLYQMVEERFRRGTNACGDCTLCSSR